MILPWLSSVLGSVILLRIHSVRHQQQTHKLRTNLSAVSALVEANKPSCNAKQVRHKDQARNAIQLKVERALGDDAGVSAQQSAQHSALRITTRTCTPNQSKHCELWWLSCVRCCVFTHRSRQDVENNITHMAGGRPIRTMASHAQAGEVSFQVSRHRARIFCKHTRFSGRLQSLGLSQCHRV